MAQNSKHVIVIGSGFAGLSAAIESAHLGHQVTLLEKNADPGGRARKFTSNEFTFDMGPSWYWMPDVFDTFFETYGKKVSDYYELKRLDPSYRVVFQDGPFDVPASIDELKKEFEALETGAAQKFQTFLDEAKIKYDIGMSKFVQKPGHSILEFCEFQTFKDALKLHIVKSFSSYVRKQFSHPKILQILEFPVLFLGAKPQNTPALYSLMNYADTSLGTWYPLGGMHKVIEGFVSLAKEKKVKLILEADVQEILIEKGVATGVRVNDSELKADCIIAAADYYHVDQHLIPSEYRMYNKNYWNTRTMAPSSLLFYIGVKRKVKGLKHHNLFFDADFEQHAQEIYDTHVWPTNPLFYVCCPSITDDSVAPIGSENIFLLMPLSTEIEDSEKAREEYYEIMMERLIEQCGDDFRQDIVFKRSYAHKDFIEDYNAFKGNAYGLANTLKQTAFLKPKMKSTKVKGLFFAGQLTTPGPGVPPSIISGQVAAKEVHKFLKHDNN